MYIYANFTSRTGKDAPQARSGMKTAFEPQRNSFRHAAANPQSTAATASTCKQAVETARQSTAAYKCEW